MKKTIAIIINLFIAVLFIVLPAWVKAQETQAKIT
jgi:predicted secreted protein